jgi:23S rRNA (guanosine2251-2'-O)-methyltransferase
MQAKLLVGFHAVTARLRARPQSLRAVYIDQRRRDGRMLALLDALASRGVRPMAVAAERLDAMCGGTRHQGVVAQADAGDRALSLDELLPELHSRSVLLLLDGVEDPRNLGACLRVADGAGAAAVIVPRDRAVGLTAVAEKAASGAAETVPLISVTNLARALEQLAEAQVWLVGADAGAEQDVFELDLRGPCAWVVGAEGRGLRRLTRENCDQLARIPMYGTCESLNASVAAALGLYAMRRRCGPPLRSNPG